MSSERERVFTICFKRMFFWFYMMVKCSRTDHRIRLKFIFMCVQADHRISPQRSTRPKTFWIRISDDDVHCY